MTNLWVLIVSGHCGSPVATIGIIDDIVRLHPVLSSAIFLGMLNLIISSVFSFFCLCLRFMKHSSDQRDLLLCLFLNHSLLTLHSLPHLVINDGTA